ncbi:hypothetical protein B9Q01_02190 [Candidatus Marsarchaeota G1 archaeon OSP_D]|uniref:Amino acid permease/ SLC12A domain-containing protein n=3 Tax=Candidatus Marsarchaeota group 1 TaxID=2203770 RepID=A0A2R6AJV5_9ARCH|nr:MAG: hypothetical protein B9Q01_02190 [Candidatus Marsarchaeota G1 archaeon OSP_D]PSN86654.1 MAG: hypothetical protein B9Q02_01445 [Candidatus Marsarchaeota G1 archaeon BE_D]PSN89075.1 MAG: hypothetical protein B9Q00_02825 [Candidatus Marsarchaeota G1 archaeon OSP_C]
MAKMRATYDPPRLKRNAIGIFGSYAQAMAVTAPLGSVVSSLAAGAIFAGANLPLVTFFAFLTSVLWIFLLTSFSKKINSAGGFYTYTSNSIGPKAGYLEAITEFLAFLFTTVFEGMYVGIIVPSLLSQFGVHLPTWSWIPLTMIGVGLAIPFTYLDVAKALTKYVAVGATLEVIVLFGLSLYLIISAGYHNTLAVFTDLKLAPRGVAGLSTGYLLAVISIAGAGTATYLGEETKTPSKTVTRGMWLALLLGGSSMLLSSYALVVAWGIANASTLGSANAPIVQLAARVSTLLAVALVLLAVNSLLVSNVGTNISASRILFSLAREKGAPQLFSKVHERHKTPYVAAFFVGAISLALALSTPLLMGFLNAYEMFAVAASFCWILGRIGDSISLPFFYLKNFREEFSVLKHVMPSFGITLVNLIGLGLSIVPLSYPSDVSIALVTIVMLSWITAFVASKRRTDMIGAYLVNDEGELVIKKSSFR